MLDWEKLSQLEDYDVSRLDKVRNRLRRGPSNARSIFTEQQSSWHSESTVAMSLTTLVDLGFAISLPRGVSDFTSYKLLETEFHQKPISWFRDEARKKHQKQQEDKERDSTRHKSLLDMADALKQMNEVNTRQEAFERESKARDDQETEERKKYDRKQARDTKLISIIGIFVGIAAIAIPIVFSTISTDQLRKEAKEEIAQLGNRIDSLSRLLKITKPLISHTDSSTSRKDTAKSDIKVKKSANPK